MNSFLIVAIGSLIISLIGKFFFKSFSIPIIIAILVYLASPQNIKQKFDSFVSIEKSKEVLQEGLSKVETASSEIAEKLKEKSKKITK